MKSEHLLTTKVSERIDLPPLGPEEFSGLSHVTFVPTYNLRAFTRKNLEKETEILLAKEQNYHLDFLEECNQYGIQLVRIKKPNSKRTYYTTKISIYYSS